MLSENNTLALTQVEIFSCVLSYILAPGKSCLLI